MATRKERTKRVRCELEGLLNVKFREMLPAKDKVLIMQYLLEQPFEKLQELTSDKYPAFMKLSAGLLVGARLNEFMVVYAQFKDEADKLEGKGNPKACKVSYVRPQ